MIAEALNAVGGGLDALMNIVPLPGKVTIIPLEKFSPVPKLAGPPFIAQFNPDSLVNGYTAIYSPDKKSGDKEPPLVFDHIQQEDLSFELLLDGTGASGPKLEVTGLIALLHQTVGFNGAKHQPNKLLVIWGHFLFTCRLVKMNTTYTLFRPNGTPLRAKVKLDFKQDTEPVLQILQMNLHSADLTHERTVKENQRLDQLCQAIYESPRHLLDVAAANGLTTFRTLRPGSQLIFPPIEN